MRFDYSKLSRVFLGISAASRPMPRQRREQMRRRKFAEDVPYPAAPWITANQLLIDVLVIAACPTKDQRRDESDVLSGCPANIAGTLPGLPPDRRNRADGVRNLRRDARLCGGDSDCDTESLDAAVVRGKWNRKIFERSFADGRADRFAYRVGGGEKLLRAMRPMRRRRRNGRTGGRFPRRTWK